MSDETKPTTGATAEQIEAAAERYAETYSGDWDLNIASAREWAPCFVPPGYVIARAEDVLTPERKAAICRAERSARLLRKMTAKPFTGIDRVLMFHDAYDVGKAFTEADSELLKAVQP